MPLCLIALIAEAPRQVTGDAMEYIAYASNLASLRAPSLSDADIASVRQLLREHEARFDDPLARPPFQGDDGRYALTHFWLYPALVAPVWRLLMPLGAHPVLPFAVVNLLLLALAARTLMRRLRPELALLLVAGPILWWVDKAQADVFVFALGTIAFAEAEGRPWLALVLAGAVATQFPPFAIVLVALPAVMWLRDRTLDHGTLGGLAAGVLLAATHPAYFLWRIGAPSPLASIGTKLRLPDGIEPLGTVIWDPNIGLLANVPVLVAALLLAAATVTARKGLGGLASAGCVTALIALPVLLLSFTVPNSFNHGGTPGMNRHALVLLILAVPLLQAASDIGWRRSRSLAWTMAVVAGVWSIVFFRPALPEQAHVPTRLAAAQWTYLPWLHDPLPEIFAERVLRRERARLPAATHNCTKVLLVGGNWPIPCIPSGEPPPACVRPGVLCYANWTGGRYRIRLAASSTGRYRFRTGSRIWPLAQASTPLAVTELARAGLDCRQIRRRLGIRTHECRRSLRRAHRRGLGRTAMRGRLVAHRRAFSRLLRRGADTDSTYAAASRLPGPSTSPWLSRFLALGDLHALRRLAPGDPAGLVRGFDGTPWIASLEDERRILVYVPARDTPARLDLRVTRAWEGALVHADDGSELDRVVIARTTRSPRTRGRPAPEGHGGPGVDRAAPLVVEPNGRDVVVMLFRTG